MRRKYITIKMKQKTTVVKKRTYIVDSTSYNYETCSGQHKSKRFDSYKAARAYVLDEMEYAKSFWIDPVTEIGSYGYSVEAYGYDQLSYGDYWYIKDAETGKIISPI